MKVINARNVNHALSQGIKLMIEEGLEVDSRGGSTLEVPYPVATVYNKPWERVLISSVRDANPFFHLMEALWILAGREDVSFLAYFNKRMAEYSDNGKTFNAPYGFRMRVAVSDHDRDGRGIVATAKEQDQIDHLIKILRKDPNSRQAVLQIWTPDDLVKSTKDKACNMSVVFRVRQGKLCVTVYNRSNDMIWGAYGANVVQFSMLQEYVAAKLGMSLGAYTQVSNSFHVYTTGAGGDTWERVATQYGYVENSDRYDYFTQSVYMVDHDMVEFDHDLKLMFNCYDQYGMEELTKLDCWQSYYFRALVVPMLKTFVSYKQKNHSALLDNISEIAADDWLCAAADWLSNRGVEL